MIHQQLLYLCTLPYVPPKTASRQSNLSYLLIQRWLNMTRTLSLSDGLRAFNPPGFLMMLAEDLAASQAIVIPPNVSLVVLSGQCGFREDGTIPEDIHEQIALAFENAERSLKAARVNPGGKNVYQMTLYYANLNEALVAAINENKRKYLAANRPVLTGVKVPDMYGGLSFEMTLYAYIGGKRESI